MAARFSGYGTPATVAKVFVWWLKLVVCVDPAAGSAAVAAGRPLRRRRERL